MRSNSYFAELEHRESNFTGNLIIGGKPHYANFKRIGKNLYGVYFKVQVAFQFLERVAFKERKKEIVVLFPFLSKYNKRKLTKIARILANTEDRVPETLLLHFLTVEKFIKAAELLDFFSIDKKKTVESLVRMELDKKVKVIDFQHLFITSYENFLKCLDELRSIFNTCFVNRNRTLNLSQVESTLKLPRAAIFFKYLLYSLRKDFSFKIFKDEIVFKKLALTEKENERMAEVEVCLKKSRLTVFTIEDVLKVSDLPYREINDSLWYLMDSGKIVRLTEKFFIVNEDLNKILNKLKKYKRNQGDMIDIKAFRELTLYSRRHILPLFEYFDSQHITRRVDSQREILLGA